MIRLSTFLALSIGAVLVTACGGGDAPTGTPGTPVGGPGAVASITLSPTSASIAVGGTTALAATARDAAGNALPGRAIAWSSSAEAIARVDAGGVVSGIAAGSATITASSEGKSASATVVVSPVATAVASVAIGAAALDTVEAWDAVAMQATVRDAAGNVLAGRPVRWSSSNPAVAAIDSVTGALVGKDRGTVTITATSDGKSASATRVVVIRYREVSAGTMHACNIASGGIVWCWGLNGREGRIGAAQLGDGASSAVPVQVPQSGPTGLRFARLSTYASHTCGLTAEGKAYCWGYNGWSQLGAPTTTAQSFTPVAVSGGHTFKQVSVGPEFSCGLTTSGAIYCWGRNDWRQFATTTVGNSDVPFPVVPERTFAAMAAGSTFACGITTGGASYCWGGNGLGQLGDGAKISYGNTFSATPVQVAAAESFKSIDAGLHFTCAVTAAGKAYCWGANGGRLGIQSTNETSTPTAVSGGLTFASVSAGSYHTCGVTTDADVYCWGGNGNGQIGITSTNGSAVPVRVAAIKGAEVSAAGIGTGFGAHSCAISADRLTTWCWGRNDTGQLGNGLTSTAVAVNAAPAIVHGQKPLPAGN